jgi:7tm Chemosensory receptor
MLRATSVVYRTLGVLPITYSQTSKCYKARPLNLIYSISTFAIIAYCFYVHITSRLSDYDASDFYGKRAISDFSKIIYTFVHISMLWTCYCAVFLSRKGFASTFNQLKMVEDRLRTMNASGEDHKRWKAIAVLGTLISVQLLVFGIGNFVGLRLAIANTGVVPSIETLITWNINPFLETVVASLFVICVAEVKKMFDIILKVLNQISQY